MTTWKFLKRHWIMSLIGLFILTTATGMIIYSVITGEGDEGFIKVDSIAGPKTKELKLNKANIPLSCMYSDSAEDIIIHYENARVAFNSQVGIEVFSPCVPWLLNSPFPDKPTLSGIFINVGYPPTNDDETIVTVFSPYEPIWGGTTFIFPDSASDYIYGSVIYINPDIEDFKDDKIDAIFMHELGHAAGLDHDRITESIMYPKILYRVNKLTSRDIKRLQEELK